MDPSRYRPISTSFVHHDQNMDVTDVVSTVTSERKAHHSFASGRMMRPSLGGVEHRISRLGTLDQDMSACLASSDVTTAVRRPVGYTFAARTAPRRRSEGTDGRPERTIAELHGGERVAVRRPGIMRRWLGRSVAGFEPRRLSMPLIRHNLHSPRAAETSQISLVKSFLRRIAGVFRLG